MFRTTVIPDKVPYQIQLSLPEDYVGMELEVIIFAKNEGRSLLLQTRKKATFTVLKTKGKKFKFNREEANER